MFPVFPEASRQEFMRHLLLNQERYSFIFSKFLENSQFSDFLIKIKDISPPECYKPPKTAPHSIFYYYSINIFLETVAIHEGIDLKNYYLYELKKINKFWSNELFPILQNCSNSQITLRTFGFNLNRLIKKNNPLYRCLRSEFWSILHRFNATDLIKTFGISIFELDDQIDPNILNNFKDLFKNITNFSKMASFMQIPAVMTTYNTSRLVQSLVICQEPFPTVSKLFKQNEFLVNNTSLTLINDSILKRAHFTEILVQSLISENSNSSVSQNINNNNKNNSSNFESISSSLKNFGTFNSLKNKILEKSSKNNIKLNFFQDNNKDQRNSIFQRMKTLCESCGCSEFLMVYFLLNLTFEYDETKRLFIFNYHEIPFLEELNNFNSNNNNNISMVESKIGFIFKRLYGDNLLMNNLKNFLGQNFVPVRKLIDNSFIYLLKPILSSIDFETMLFLSTQYFFNLSDSDRERDFKFYFGFKIFLDILNGSILNKNLTESEKTTNFKEISKILRVINDKYLLIDIFSLLFIKEKDGNKGFICSFEMAEEVISYLSTNRNLREYVGILTLAAKRILIGRQIATKTLVKGSNKNIKLIDFNPDSIESCFFTPRDIICKLLSWGEYQRALNAASTALSSNPEIANAEINESEEKAKETKELVKLKMLCEIANSINIIKKNLCSPILPKEAQDLFNIEFCMTTNEDYMYVLKRKNITNEISFILNKRKNKPLREIMTPIKKVSDLAISAGIFIKEIDKADFEEENTFIKNICQEQESNIINKQLIYFLKFIGKFKGKNSKKFGEQTIQRVEDLIDIVIENSNNWESFSEVMGEEKCLPNVLLYCENLKNKQQLEKLVKEKSAIVALALRLTNKNDYFESVYENETNNNYGKIVNNLFKKEKVQKNNTFFNINELKSIFTKYKINKKEAIAEIIDIRLSLNESKHNTNEMFRKEIEKNCSFNDFLEIYPEYSTVELENISCERSEPSYVIDFLIKQQKVQTVIDYAEILEVRKLLIRKLVEKVKEIKETYSANCNNNTINDSEIIKEKTSEFFNIWRPLSAEIFEQIPKEFRNINTQIKYLKKGLPENKAHPELPVLIQYPYLNFDEDLIQIYDQKIIKIHNSMNITLPNEINHKLETENIDFDKNLQCIYLINEKALNIVNEYSITYLKYFKKLDSIVLKLGKTLFEIISSLSIFSVQSEILSYKTLEKALHLLKSLKISFLQTLFIQQTSYSSQNNSQKNMTKSGRNSIDTSAFNSYSPLKNPSSSMRNYQNLNSLPFYNSSILAKENPTNVSSFMLNEDDTSQNEIIDSDSSSENNSVISDQTFFVNFPFELQISLIECLLEFCEKTVFNRFSLKYDFQNFYLTRGGFSSVHNFIQICDSFDFMDLLHKFSDLWDVDVTVFYFKRIQKAFILSQYYDSILLMKEYKQIYLNNGNHYNICSNSVEHREDLRILLSRPLFFKVNEMLIENNIDMKNFNQNIRYNISKQVILQNNYSKFYEKMQSILNQQQQQQQQQQQMIMNGHRRSSSQNLSNSSSQNLSNSSSQNCLNIEIYDKNKYFELFNVTEMIKKNSFDKENEVVSYFIDNFYQPFEKLSIFSGFKNFSATFDIFFNKIPKCQKTVQAVLIEIFFTAINNFYFDNLLDFFVKNSFNSDIKDITNKIINSLRKMKMKETLIYILSKFSMNEEIIFCLIEFITGGKENENKDLNNKIGRKERNNIFWQENINDLNLLIETIQKELSLRKSINRTDNYNRNKIFDIDENNNEDYKKPVFVFPDNKNNNTFQYTKNIGMNRAITTDFKYTEDELTDILNRSGLQLLFARLCFDKKIDYFVEKYHFKLSLLTKEEDSFKDDRNYIISIEEMAVISFYHGKFNLGLQISELSLNHILRKRSMQTQQQQHAILQSQLNQQKNLPKNNQFNRLITPKSNQNNIPQKGQKNVQQNNSQSKQLNNPQSKQQGNQQNNAQSKQQNNAQSKQQNNAQSKQQNNAQSKQQNNAQSQQQSKQQKNQKENQQKSKQRSLMNFSSSDESMSEIENNEVIQQQQMKIITLFKICDRLVDKLNENNIPLSSYFKQMSEKLDFSNYSLLTTVLSKVIFGRAVSVKDVPLFIESNIEGEALKVSIMTELGLLDSALKAAVRNGDREAVKAIEYQARIAGNKSVQQKCMRLLSNTSSVASAS